MIGVVNIPFLFAFKRYYEYKIFTKYCVMLPKLALEESDLLVNNLLGIVDSWLLFLKVNDRNFAPILLFKLNHNCIVMSK